MASPSTALRLTPAWKRRSWMSASGLTDRLPPSDSRPSISKPAGLPRGRSSAILRRGEENSRARISISQTAFGFTQRFEGELEQSSRLRAVPTVPPLNHCEAARSEVLLQSGGNDLFGQVQPVEIDVVKGEPSA